MSCPGKVRFPDKKANPLELRTVRLSVLFREDSAMRPSGFDVGGCDPFAVTPSSAIVRQRADVRIKIAFELVEALASGFDFRKVAGRRVKFIAMGAKPRPQAGQRYHPSRMP